MCSVRERRERKRAFDEKTNIKEELQSTLDAVSKKIQDELKSMKPHICGAINDFIEKHYYAFKGSTWVCFLIDFCSIFALSSHFSY